MLNNLDSYPFSEEKVTIKHDGKSKNSFEKIAKIRRNIPQDTLYDWKKLLKVLMLHEENTCDMIRYLLADQNGYGFFQSYASQIILTITFRKPENNIMLYLDKSHKFTYQCKFGKVQNKVELILYYFRFD